MQQVRIQPASTPLSGKLCVLSNFSRASDLHTTATISHVRAFFCLLGWGCWVRTTHRKLSAEQACGARALSAIQIGSESRCPGDTHTHTHTTVMVHASRRNVKTNKVNGMRMRPPLPTGGHAATQAEVSDVQHTRARLVIDTCDNGILFRKFSADVDARLTMQKHFNRAGVLCAPSTPANQ